MVAIAVFLQWLGIIPSRYPLTHFDEKEVILKRRRSLTKRFLWKDIAAIFPFSFCRSDMQYCRNFAFELTDGESVGFVILRKGLLTARDALSEPKKFYKIFLESFIERKKHEFVAGVLEQLYKIFLESLNDKKIDVKKVDFSHPTRWVKSKYRFFKMHCIFFAFGVLAMIYVGSNFKGWGPYLFPLPFLFLFSIIILVEWLINHSHQCLLSLKVHEDKLTWRDEFGRADTKSLSEVKSFKLDKIKGCLEFSDGAKLRDLEKLRYWPILREYLLSKLEPKEKNDNK